MPPRTARPDRTIDELLAEVDAALAERAPALHATLLPRLEPSQVGTLPTSSVPAEALDLLGWHAGQSEPVPLHPELPWSLLTREELIAALQAGPPEGLFPLLRHADGGYVYVALKDDDDAPNLPELAQDARDEERTLQGNIESHPHETPRWRTYATWLEAQGRSPDARELRAAHEAWRRQRAQGALGTVAASGEFVPAYPSLMAWLFAVLDAHGVESTVPRATTLPLEALLAELERAATTPAPTPELAPALVIRFRAPATIEQLAALEAELGSPLPDALRAWFSWHDGEEPGAGLLDLARTAAALSIDEALVVRAELAARELLPEGRWWLPLTAMRDADRLPCAGMDDRGRIVVVRTGDRPPLLRHAQLEDWVPKLRAYHVVRRANAGRRLPDDYSATVARRWVLAVGGYLTELGRARHDLLGRARPLMGSEVALRSLREWWSIEDAGELVRTLETLITRHEASDEELDRDGIAWDLGRVPYLAGMGFRGFLLDASTAWGYLVHAARIVQRSFSSWHELGAGYDRRRQELGFTNEEAGIVARLLAPGGAWAELPWDVELGNPPPPIVPPRERTVVPDDCAGLTLADALATLEAGDRLRLTPGVYREPVELVGFVELVATAPEVVLAPARNQQALHVIEGALYAEGLEIRAGATPGAPKLGLRVAKDEFALLRRCTITAESNGVVVGGTLRLEDSTVSSRRRCGVVASVDGRVHVSGGRLERCGAAGLELYRNATATVRGTRFSELGTHAIVSFGGKVVAHELYVTGAALGAITVSQQGSLEVADSTIEATTTSGFVVAGASQAKLASNDVTGATTAVEVREGAQVSLTRCELRDLRWRGVWASDPNTTVTAEDCTIGRTHDVSVLAQKGARVTLERCTLGPRQTTPR